MTAPANTAELVERLRAPDAFNMRGPDYEPIMIPASDLRLEAASTIERQAEEIAGLREGLTNLSSAAAFVFNRLTNGRPSTRQELTDRLRGPIDAAQAISHAKTKEGT